MLAVHIQQRALEAVRFAFQRHDLLLCQGDIVPHALFAVLGLDVGRTDDFGRFLLGFPDHIVPQALGVDHRRAQGVLLGTVLVDALRQHHELFLQIVILRRQCVHALGDLFR